VFVQKTDTYDIFHTSIIIIAILTTRDNYIQELERRQELENAQLILSSCIKHRSSEIIFLQDVHSNKLYLIHVIYRNY